MIKVQIEKVEVDDKRGTSQRTGKPYSIREQVAWGFFCDQEGRPHPHPQRIRITLGDLQDPYPVGLYQIADESFFPDRFGQVTCRVKLRPLTASSAAVQPAARAA